MMDSDTPKFSLNKHMAKNNESKEKHTTQPKRSKEGF